MKSKITIQQKASVTLRMLCCLLLMAGMWTTNANAQAAYSNDFNVNSTGWTGTITRTTATTACGSASMRRNMYSSVTTGNMVSPTCGTSNGALATLSYAYKVANWSANTVGTSGWGSFNVQYGATATGPWTTFQTINTGNHVVSGTCSTVVVTFTPPSGALFIKWDAFWTAGDYYINFDNVVVSQAASSPCAGTPAPGNTVSSANPVCSGVNFTLSLQNATSGTGVTYQWYKDAVLVSGATNATYVTSQTAAASYYCDVTCSAGPSTFSSNPLSVTMSGFSSCYCSLAATSTPFEKISNVTIGSINNTTSSTAGYENWTAQSTNISTQTAIPISISVSSAYASDDRVFIAIDYNQNGIFDVGEVLYSDAVSTFCPTCSGTAATLTGTITVPTVGAIAGVTRMRVQLQDYASNTPQVFCGTYTYGQVEDYNVNITLLAPCSTPAPGNTLPVSPSVCAGGTVNLSLQNATPGTGVTYQWYDGAGAIGGATNDTYTTPALFASETYHCDVTCSTGPSTVSSNNTTVSIAAAPVGGTASGPATGLTYQNLAYSVSGYTGSIQWQYSTTAIGGPYTDIPGATNSTLNITANGAGTYYVRVKAFNAGCTDDFSTVVTTVVSVDGDNVCGAITLALGNNGPYTNSGATTEGGEPVPPSSTCADQIGWCTSGISNSVWFSFTPAVSGKYSFGNNGNLNLWDNQLALYSSATCGDVLVGGATLLAANDDSTVSTSPFKAWIAPVCLTGGVTYYLQLDGYITTVNTAFGIRVDKAANVAPVISACPGPVSVVNDAGLCTGTASWSDPSATDDCGAVSVACVPVSGSVFPEGVTSVTCTATDAENATSQCSFNVTVNVNHATAASGISDNALYGQICSPGTLNLSVVGGSLGTAGGDWVWYDGGCGSGASVGTGASISIVPSVGSHNYFVRAEEPGCPANTACVSDAISVITAPPLNTIHYTASIADGCVGAPAATFSVNAVASCTFYNWTSSQAGVRFNGNPSPYQTTVPTVNVTFVGLPPAGASGWSICVFGGNACGSTNTICTWVRATVSIPGSLSGSNIGCPGSTGNPYSSSAVAGAVSYQWSSTGGITIVGNGAQAVTVDFAGGFVSGTLSVHGQTACGYNGPNRTINITRAPSIPGTISGPSYPCPNGSAAYSVAAVPGAVDYTWTTSVAGAIVTGTSTSCSIAFPAVIPAGSTVSVTANSSCPFSSAVRSKGIANGIPGVPANISGPATGQCGETGVSYSITPVVLATGYSWSTTCGTIQGPNNLSGITMDWPGSFGSCIVTVAATNACGTGGSRTLAVSGNPATPPSISGNAAPCANSVEGYSTVGSVGATSYTWTVPGGATIIGPANGSSVLVQFGSLSGNITATASNACGNSGPRTLPCVISCRQSQVIASATAFSAEVYPNPASGKATVKFTAATALQYHLNMTDVLGQQVLSTEGTSAEGINMIDLDLNNFAKGVYTLNIMSGDYNEQIKLIVQ